MAHTHFMLDANHTPRICSTYCFSTATIAARTHLSACLVALLLKTTNIYVYKRWDTSVGKSTSYWPDSSLFDVYITYKFKVLSASALRNT